MNTMRYTIYILRCLRTGTLWFGVTDSLRERMDEIIQSRDRLHISQPEVLHIEQHDDMQLAHRRLQTIRTRWDTCTPRSQVTPVTHSLQLLPFGTDA